MKQFEIKVEHDGREVATAVIERHHGLWVGRFVSGTTVLWASVESDADMDVWSIVQTLLPVAEVAQ